MNILKPCFSTNVEESIKYYLLYPLMFVVDLLDHTGRESLENYWLMILCTNYTNIGVNDSWILRY